MASSTHSTANDDVPYLPDFERSLSGEHNRHDPAEALTALLQAAAAVIDDASPCTTADHSMVADELLCNLISAVASIKQQ